MQELFTTPKKKISEKDSKKQMKLNLDLISAIQENDPKRVISLLENKADPNYLDQNLNNSLHHACRSDASSKIEIIRSLIQYGANVNHQGEFKRSCLYSLDLRQEHAIHVIELLLQQGLNPNHVDAFCNPFIFEVCTAINQTNNNKNQYTPLVNIYKLLLMYGVDLTLSIYTPSFRVFFVPQYHDPEFNTIDFILVSLLYRRQDHKKFVPNIGYYERMVHTLPDLPDQDPPSRKLLQFIWTVKEEDEMEKRRLYVKQNLFDAMVNQIYKKNEGLLSKNTRQSLLTFFCSCNTLNKNTRPSKWIRQKIATRTFDFTLEFMSSAHLTMNIADDIINKYSGSSQNLNPHKRTFNLI